MAGPSKCGPLAAGTAEAESNWQLIVRFGEGRGRGHREGGDLVRPLLSSLSPRSGPAGWGKSPGEGGSRSQARAPPAGADPAQDWDGKDEDTQ